MLPERNQPGAERVCPAGAGTGTGAGVAGWCEAQGMWQQEPRGRGAGPRLGVWETSESGEDCPGECRKKRGEIFNHMWLRDPLIARAEAARVNFTSISISFKTLRLLTELRDEV